jgi:hypothetical protein
MRDLSRLVLEMEESSGYQLIEKRGEAKGERRALIWIILRQGRKKFGEPDAATLSLVEGLADVDRLEAITDRLLDATTWQELLA